MRRVGLRAKCRVYLAPADAVVGIVEPLAVEPGSPLFIGGDTVISTAYVISDSSYALPIHSSDEGQVDGQSGIGVRNAAL